MTADHPFWLDRGLMVGKAGWIQAGDLMLGDRLRTPTGTDAAVLGVRRGVGRAAVYTLTVAKDHTFFVGTAKVLVHNANCDEEFLASLDSLSRKEIAKEISKEQVEKLGEFFGDSLQGVRDRLQDFSLPKGLTRESLLRYKVIAEKTIAEGRDKLGVQKLRLELVERALREL